MTQPTDDWSFCTYCFRCGVRADKAADAVWCGDTVHPHQWRRDHFRGLIDLIEEAGAVAYVHDPDCNFREAPLGACSKQCGKRAYEAARARNEVSKAIVAWGHAMKWFVYGCVTFSGQVDQHGSYMNMNADGTDTCSFCGGLMGVTPRQRARLVSAKATEKDR